jgi:hypothetical protein
MSVHLPSVTSGRSPKPSRSPSKINLSIQGSPASTVRREWANNGHTRVKSRDSSKHEAKAVPGLAAAQPTAEKSGFGSPLASSSPNSKLKPTAIARPRGIKLLRKKVQQMTSVARLYRASGNTDDNKKSKNWDQGSYKVPAKKQPSQDVTLNQSEASIVLNAPEKKMRRYECVCVCVCVCACMYWLQVYLLLYICVCS